jgi:hypothetical protein
MSPALHPDGTPVEVEGVSVSAPGFTGTVEVRTPRAGVRALPPTDPLSRALAATDMQEVRTVTVDLAPAPLTRGLGRGPSAVTVTVPPPPPDQGQAVLVENADGSRQWVLPDAAGTFALPGSAAPAGTRGLFGNVGTRILKTLAFPLIGKVAGVAANRFATHWEKEHHPHRLRTFAPDNYTSADVPDLTAGDLKSFGDKPTLLFVHGTMSTSYTGFGGIRGTTMKELYERYGGRVIAFDHPTVSVSPTDNVRRLTELLDDAALTVDIVAHSRGGLVSRVLTEQPDVAGAALTVRRLVMVGTPNGGTALANSDHLLGYLDRLTNLIDLVPDNPVTDTLGVIISVVKQLAAGAFDGLPGLTAMRPGDTWLNQLNSGVHKPSARYFAVASNFEPPANSPLATIARDGLTDRVFEDEENDLVVPTSGVYAKNGAHSFPIATPLTFKAMASIDHSHYWQTEEFTTSLLDWLG